MLNSSVKLDNDIRNKLFEGNSSVNTVTEKKKEKLLSLNSNFIEDNMEFGSRSASGSPSEGFVTRMTSKSDAMNNELNNEKYTTDLHENSSKSKNETLKSEVMKSNSKTKKKNFESKDLRNGSSESRLNKELVYPQDTDQYLNGEGIGLDNSICIQSKLINDGVSVLQKQQQQQQQQQQVIQLEPVADFILSISESSKSVFPRYKCDASEESIKDQLSNPKNSNSNSNLNSNLLRIDSFDEKSGTGSRSQLFGNDYGNCESITKKESNIRLLEENGDSDDKSIRPYTSTPKKRKLNETKIVYSYFGPTLPQAPKICALRCLEYLEGSDFYNMSILNRLWSKTATDNALWE